MKKLFTLFLLFGLYTSAISQQLYMDFESTKVASLAEWSGMIDSMAVNPGVNTVNNSSVCASYTRSIDMYDNFKLFPYAKLVDVSPYAVTGGAAPKITMKVYSTAPAGTKIDLQLGIRTNTNYPQGVHSEYTATTTTQNAWELITFNFVKIPTGSLVNPDEIDKIVILFNPGTTTTDVYYFDDPSGPQLTIIGFPEYQNEISLFKTMPNPASDIAKIQLETKSAGKVVLKLYDILGRPVTTLLDEELGAGLHNLQLNTESIAGGTYFFELKKGEVVQTSKLTITK